MGLGLTLNNAISGLTVTQNSLDVVSRNISNSGTPGYHKQALTTVDRTGVSSNYATSTTVTRAFNAALQAYYTTETADSAKASVQADYTNQLQIYLGKPGATGSLDSVYGNFQTAISTLTASPDDYSARATAVSSAQSLAATLNQLSKSVQGLRQQANGQIQQDVASVNQALKSLQQINDRLGNLSMDPASRAAMLDQRDRLVTQVAGLMDVNTTYRDDGSVALATRSGVTLLDRKASVLNFAPVSNIGARSEFNADDSQNGVGKLTITTASGVTLDLVKQNALQSGELAGLVNLRDNILVQAQGQLDAVAAAISKALSTNSVPGTAVSGPGTSAGLSVGVGALQSGDDVLVNVTTGGKAQSVRVVDVEDAGKLPLNFVGTDGVRVIGAQFSAGPAGVEASLQAALGPGFTVSGTGTGATAALTILNDGTAGNSVNGLTARTASTATQGGGLGLSLFLDSGKDVFTDSLDGAGQRLGYAARISINPEILANNTKLVQADASQPIGDVARVNYLFDQLQGMTFSFASTGRVPADGAINGTVTDLISQALDYQGASAAAQQAENESHSGAMDALSTRMDSDYGVNINDEMAQLVQLQAAYSANARVVSVAQDLINALLQAVTR